MSKKTDYKKMYRKLKSENSRLFNQYNELKKAINTLMEVPEVAEFLKGFEAKNDMRVLQVKAHSNPDAFIKTVGENLAKQNSQPSSSATVEFDEKGK